MMDAAVAIEDSIYALSQPPYPPIPAHELYGNLLMRLNRPAAAEKQYAQTLKRTPRRPNAIYGLARSAQALGKDNTASMNYAKFLVIWRNADRNLPQVGLASRYAAARSINR